MPIEIERKFLVKNNSFKSESFKTLTIKQGFLNSDKNRVVRVRTLDDTGFITIKGISSKDGTSRFEWEKEISLSDANALLLLCEETIIEKKRYLIKSGKHTFEVDEFYGANNGLVVAEVELNAANESFNTPSWLGEEVTGLTKYYNSELSKNPFKNWA
ncbi:MAG: adenylate cyclase [Flavobacteriaceae bacterium]|nr:MAG: adenylate cyclase [Flavobacteriaceae bacterium]